MAEGHQKWWNRLQDQRPPQDTSPLLHSDSTTDGLSRSSHRCHTSSLCRPMCRMCHRQLGPRACGPRGSLHQLLESLLNSQPQVRTKIGHHLSEPQNGRSTTRFVCLAGSALISLAPAIPWRGGVAALQGNSAAPGPVTSSSGRPKAAKSTSCQGGEVCSKHVGRRIPGASQLWQASKLEEQRKISSDRLLRAPTESAPRPLDCTTAVPLLCSCPSSSGNRRAQERLYSLNLTCTTRLCVVESLEPVSAYLLVNTYQQKTAGPSPALDSRPKYRASMLDYQLTGCFA